MKFLQLFILILFTQSLCAQQHFAPVGAKWHYQDWCYHSPIFGNCGFIYYEVSKDTTVATKQAVIVERPSIPESKIIFHEDNGNLYFYEDAEFKLIFDFNLTKGDTLQFRIPKNYAYYDVSCTGGWDSVLYQAIIDSVSIFSVDNVPLKQFYTSALIMDSSKYWNLGIITERIFGMSNYFGSGPIFCLGGFAGHFRCYEDADIFYKPVAEACDDATGIIEPLNNEIFIFPNPASDVIRITTINQKISINIFSLEGKLIKIINLSGNENFISVTDLPSGAYILHSKEINLFRKLIKL